MSRGHAECCHERDLSTCESLHEYGHVAITTSLQTEITTSRCIPLSQGPFLDASYAPIAAVPPRAEIFLVVQFVAIFLSCLEMTCVRDSRYDLDLSRSNNSNKDRQNSTKEKDEVEVDATSRRRCANGQNPSREDLNSIARLPFSRAYTPKTTFWKSAFTVTDCTVQNSMFYGLSSFASD